MGRNRSKCPDITLHLTEKEVSNLVIALALQYTSLDAGYDERSEIRPTMAYLENKLEAYRK